MDHFIPEDNESSDSVHQQYIRQLIANPLDTQDDEDFTKEEILAVLEKFNPHKAPGEDGFNRDILLKIFSIFPTFITGLYTISA
jgi:3-deoxy-D-arabino-heptulosonate 7-phosphate (DAHP) synthase class II